MDRKYRKDGDRQNRMDRMDPLIPLINPIQPILDPSDPSDTSDPTPKEIFPINLKGARPRRGEGSHVLERASARENEQSCLVYEA